MCTIWRRILRRCDSHPCEDCPDRRDEDAARDALALSDTEHEEKRELNRELQDAEDRVRWLEINASVLGRERGH